jgi:hypothetical protein
VFIYNDKNEAREMALKVIADAPLAEGGNGGPLGVLINLDRLLMILRALGLIDWIKPE